MSSTLPTTETSRPLRAILVFDDLDHTPRILPIADTDEEAEAVRQRVQEAFERE